MYDIVKIKITAVAIAVDGVIGILGLAPYFFETQAYLYGGENNFWGASFELERDLLLTQKLITQP